MAGYAVSARIERRRRRAWPRRRRATGRGRRSAADRPTPRTRSTSSVARSTMPGRALGGRPRALVADDVLPVRPRQLALTLARDAATGPKRAGSSAAGGRRDAPSMQLGEQRPGRRPVEMPHGPWPAAIHRPSTPGTRPTSGRPSRLSGGRRPAARRSARVAMRRHERSGPLERCAAATGGRVGLVGEERRARASCGPPAVTRLKAWVAGVVSVASPGSMSISASSRTWRGGCGEVDVDDDAPQRPDRPPSAGRVDEAPASTGRRPRRRPAGGDPACRRRASDAADPAVADRATAARPRRCELDAGVARQAA